MERDWYDGGGRNKRSYDEFSGQEVVGGNICAKRLRVSRRSTCARGREMRRRDAARACNRVQEHRQGGAPPQSSRNARQPSKKKGKGPASYPRRLDLSSSGVGQGTLGVGDSQGDDVANITCYKCGQLGHLQAACMTEPFCIKCKKEGHLSAMFTTSLKGEDAVWLGFGVEGRGFCGFEVPENE
jgi:hypothetical protein